MKPLYLIIILLLTGCTAPQTHKIALIAPFEGQYSTIGYNALYAARLALIHAQTTSVELLVVDDGGTPDSALSRLTALEQDPTVRYILAITPHLTHHDDPRFITLVNWQPSDDPTTLNDGEWLIHNALGEPATTQTILTDASALTDEFTQNYLDSALYVPQPNLLAPLIYDATQMLIANIIAHPQ